MAIQQKITCIVVLLLAMGLPLFSNAGTSVVINEIAWMGTKAGSADEWIELHNPTNQPINLSGWGIHEKGGETLVEDLNGTIAANGYYLIERTDDTTISSVLASQEPTAWGGNGLSNSGEFLILKNANGGIIDEVNASSRWFAGVASPGYTSMERIDPAKSGNDSANWSANDGIIRNGADAGGNPILGTPNAQNSSYLAESQLGQEENQPPREEPLNSNPPPQNQSQGNNPPKAKAEVSETNTVAGKEINFDASGSSDVDGDTLSSSWNFGDGNQSQNQTTSHRYDEPDTYNVVLMVSDGALESYDYITITITEPHYATTVFINEFIPNPTGSDEENEWIELVNESDAPANISGWKLDDEETGNKEFTIPEGTTISPRAFFVFPRTKTNIALNNDGDTVRLILPNGEVFQEVTYEKSKKGWSAARFGDNWSWQETPTPRSKNLKETSRETAEQIADEPSRGIISSTLSDPSSPERTSKANNEEDNLPSKKENALAAIGVSSSSSFLPVLLKNGLLMAILIALASGGVLLFLKRRIKSSL